VYTLLRTKIYRKYEDWSKCFDVGAGVITRAVRKVSGHIEYLENRSSSLDVTWQPVRGDLTAHPWTVTVPWGYSVGGETPLSELLYCVTVAFTMTERRDKLHRENDPAHSTALMQAFSGKASHHPGLSDPLQPRFGSLRLLKSPLKGRRFVNATVTQYTSSVNGVSLPTD
jgi:hypothetical protein